MTSSFLCGLHYGWRLFLKVVLAVLLLGLGAVIARAQAAFISVSGDYGDISSTIKETSGSTREEPAESFWPPPSAYEAVPFQGCPPAKVTANIVFSEPVVADPVASLSLTARAIERRRKSGDAADDLGSGFLVLGDYRPNLAFSAFYQLSVAILPGNFFHACVRELNVSATFTPVITIAREITHGSCLEHEVLAHERGHWAIDNETLPGLGPQLEEAATAGVMPGFDGETMAEVQSRLGAALSSSLDEFVDIFKTARQAGQAAHDSPEERERIDHACDRAASEVAARVHGTLPPKPAP